MRKIFTTLSIVFAATAAFSNPQWENAEYIALGYLTTDSSQRALMYFDGSGTQLGYVSLETSAYASAVSIAYGAGVTPNLGGENGMMLLREIGDSASSNYRTINFYADPITTSTADGAQMGRTQSCTYGSIYVASNQSSAFIDIARQLERNYSNGLITMLVERYNKDTNALMTSYIYKYQMPETLSQGGGISRIENATQMPRWDIASVGIDDAVNFASGVFSTKGSATETNQFAILGADGTVKIALGADLNTSFSTIAATFSIAKDGLDIVSIWGDDNYSLMALYSDNSVVTYDARDGTEKFVTSFNPDYTVLDVVKVNPIIVPEPSAYAAFFGLAALAVIALRKRK